MAVKTRLDDVFFQRAFLVAQLTSVKRTILVALDQGAGGRNLERRMENLEGLVPKLVANRTVKNQFF
jgi:hypothetical protein